MKKGFTIIELLMVVAILAVLLGIVTTAATASIRQARDRRAQAMKQTLQNGIAAYRVRNNKWPDPLETWATTPPGKGTVGYMSNGDYDTVVQIVLEASTGQFAKNRVMDPVGLLVMNAQTFEDGKPGGRDFREAVKKNSRYTKTMSPGVMTIVYQDKETGNAYRYIIEYNTESDDVAVLTQNDYRSRYGKWWGKKRGNEDAEGGTSEVWK